MNTLVEQEKKSPLERRNNYWIAVREAGKEARLSLTDAISLFNQYEDETGGSTAPERAFSNFTRSIYAPFGLNKREVEDKHNSRDALDVIVLDALRLIEGSAAELIMRGMEQERPRKEIKLAVKQLAKEIAGTISRVEQDFFIGGGAVQ
ncbi:hypothetical protein GTA62_14770 [Roseobacter sp. HKCCD9010]|uniref:hypothetical protein n=1 Tax=unclassified Roseobacter TaxID=196798 RepID=UPI00149101DF|nr:MULTISPECIES: hypothetical protein [unclassified Roseobacter]MBF9050626.1 hypothetical protein [Rhodobacterales bacterium HKCCD4356]NNV11956.1 hypothetical protein [Roseobacter sp. HKCCD7357]NNV16969.1 hypothetical protein [Roseobacter sp. HKCCD8768]NNV26198.1 hypothetical protein [Roseobacter sp. HKCCD8192]NNV30693.1 hypothetical protein [Roseobacter sp. HKCCD9061]